MLRFNKETDNIYITILHDNKAPTKRNLETPSIVKSLVKVL